jgi:hypothetical protein
MVIETEKSEIGLGIICWIVIEVRNLSFLARDIAVEAKADAAPTPAQSEHRSFDCLRQMRSCHSFTLPSVFSDQRFNSSQGFSAHLLRVFLSHARNNLEVLNYVGCAREFDRSPMKKALHITRNDSFSSILA